MAVNTMEFFLNDVLVQRISLSYLISIFE